MKQNNTLKLRSKALTFVLALTMVFSAFGMLPGVVQKAHADNTETLLTTITAVGASNAPTATSANVSYSTEDIATLTFSQVTPDGYGRVSYVPTWGWWGYGITLSVTPADGYTITKCVFYDNKDNNATDSEAPFVVETAEDNKMPKVNGSYIYPYSDSAGVKKIEVYGYAAPAATHSVTITEGDHMTKTADSGEASQTDLSGAMTDVVYTANDGYYFPEDYAVTAVNGISVTRNSYTQITVSGTPTADAEITLTAPTAKTTPDAPTTAAAENCTTADNNDGKLTGVTTAMEYKKADADSWTDGTGSDITGLAPGTYYVRVKATDTTLASDNQELTIKGLVARTVKFKVVNGSWNDATDTEKTVTLTGHEGDELKLASDQIPAVGNKPADTYKKGSWDTEPNTTTAITADTTYTYTYAAMGSQTIAAEDVTATYGDTDKKVTATVSDPTTGAGAISYAVKEGSEDYIDVDASNGSLTIKKVPANGKVYVVVTAAKTDDYLEATKEVTVTIAHKITEVAEVPATCEKDGVEKHWKDEEETLYKDAEGKETVTEAELAIPALGHKMTKHDEVQAKCTENGAKAYWTCETCKKMFADEKGEKEISNPETIPALGHKMTKHDEVQAKCTEDGTKAYWTCETCKKMFADEKGEKEISNPETIPALGHKYGAWTKLDDTQHQRVCEHDKTHVEKANHTWDSGKVTKEATTTAEGVKTFTCTVCKATKTESIPKLNPAPTSKPVLAAKGIAKGKTAVNLSWNKVSGADRYVIYFARCNQKGRSYVLKKVKTVNGKTLKWSKGKLAKNTAYKFYVVAQKKSGKSYKNIAKSKVGHFYTGNVKGKYTNPKSLTLKKSAYTLKKGETATIKASVSKVKTNKKLATSHAATYRYTSNNPAVATVNAKGKVTAKAKGTAVIYVQTINGIWKTCKVTVK